MGGCFKAVPKQSYVTYVNDYRTVALTPIPAKCLEWLVIKHTKEAVPRSLNQYQFAGKDHEGIKDKTRRALVQHVIKFCEHDELLDMEDKGMAVLLDLNDTLEALLESRLETDGAGSAPLVSSAAIGEGEEEVAQTADPTSEVAQAADFTSGEQKDGTPRQSSLQGQAARDNRTTCQGRVSTNSCLCFLCMLVSQTPKIL